MQEIKNAAAVFCTACICAEVVCQLLGGTRMRSCIKTVAGLYIVVSVLQALPGIGAQARQFAPPAAGPADFGSFEDAVLDQTARQLAQQLQARLLEQTGCAFRLQIELVQAQGEVAATAVRATPEGACTARQKEQAAAVLQRELALGPEAVTVENEEDVP